MNDQETEISPQRANPLAAVVLERNGSTALREYREKAGAHQELAKLALDNGDEKWVIEHMTTARIIRSLCDSLEDANGMCRSAYQVALRDGEETNWRPFKDRLEESLKRQHAVMYPSNKVDNHSCNP